MQKTPNQGAFTVINMSDDDNGARKVMSDE